MTAETVVLELPMADGTLTRLRCDIGRAAVDRAMPLLQRCNARNDIYVAHHIPAGSDGTDIFSRLQALHPGHYWHIGSTMFETDRIPASWVGSCNRMDEIWVPTAFNRGTFASSGVDADRIRVMPFGIGALTRPAVPGTRYHVATEKSFRFLSVFELTKRKGWDVLVRAWLDAFRPEDDVALVMRTYGRGGRQPVQVLTDFIISLGRDPADIPEIVLVEDRLSDEQMVDLYAQCQAFVLPTRGEGWGMPYLEALALGVPVIATRWSAQLEFLHDENSFLVDIDGVVEVDAEQVQDDPLYRGHRWAAPSVNSLVEQMRRVHGDVDGRRRRAARGLTDARDTWNVAAMAQRMKKRFDEIEAQRVIAVGPPDAGPASVIWTAPLYDPSGYASEARSFVRGLENHGVVRCRTEPLVWNRHLAELDHHEQTMLHRLCNRPAEENPIRVQHVLGSSFKRVPGARAMIGRTMFETDRLPAGWADACNTMDEVWVPCHHNVEMFARAGVDPQKLVRVPGTLDFERWPVDGPRDPQVPSKPFVFLSVFDWTYRKGWDVLLRAYAEAFTARDNVLLVMKITLSCGMKFSHVADFVPKYVAALTPRGRTAPPVRLIGAMTQSDLPALYRAANCFVMPTRGEGFGRPFLEAMAVGTPAIGTAWSGQVDFMTPDNSWLIPYELTEVMKEAVNEVPYFSGHRWAEPDVVALRRILREAARDPAATRARGLRAAADVRVSHNPANITRLIEERLARF